MDECKLLEPSVKLKEQLSEFKEEFLELGEEIPGSSGLADASSIEDWLLHLAEFRSWESVPKNRIPGIIYLLERESDHKILGITNLRLGLNEALLNYGGHIGYAVRPSERRQGYGVQMLQKTLGKAVAEGIQKVLVTCDDDNFGSIKVIELNGGILEDKRVNGDKLTRRYWIDAG